MIILTTDRQHNHRMVLRRKVSSAYSPTRQSASSFPEQIGNFNQVERILTYLRSSGIECFYHVTDYSNLCSIENEGGLYSWDYCNRHDITIPMPGGNALSRWLDLRYNLQDYVRLSFTRNLPMLSRLRREGFRLIRLTISLDVLNSAPVLFSAGNATANAHRHGDGLKFLQSMNLRAAQSECAPGDPDYELCQSEIMIRTHVPMNYILAAENI